MTSSVVCYLVGAGPGEIELLTLRAKDLLSSAEVVIYDHLIPEEALSFTPPHCKLIDVGKVREKSNGEKTSQIEINQTIVDEYQRLKNIPLTFFPSDKQAHANHHKIIRLKGGDPFIFARSTEELNTLKQHHIPYEVVPGISSFYAVPAYAGIPLTIRNISRSFSVITGHFSSQANQTKNEAIISHSDTVVYLMGIKNLPTIIEANLKANKSPETPVAIIQNGTMPQQKTIITTIKDAVADRDRYTINHPGIVVIGEVAKHHQEYQWFEKKPLFKQKVGILRSKLELNNLVKPLKDLGAEVVSMPLMTCKPIVKNYPKLIDKLIANSQHILFTSAYAVECTIEAIMKAGYDTRLLGRHKIITIGEATNNSLKKYYLQSDFIAKEASQDGVFKLINSLISEKKISQLIFPRALVVRQFLEKQLAKTELKVDSIILYENQSVEKSSIKKIQELDYLLFTSSRVIEFLFKHPDIKNITNWPTTISIGKITHKTLASKFNNFANLATQSTVADTPSFNGLVKKVLDLVDNHK